MINLPPGFNSVDIIALFIILIGAVQGFFRGLSGEIARLAGTILAFVAGVLLREPVGRWIVDNTKLEEQAAHAAAFITTVLLALTVLILLRIIVKRIVKIVFAEAFDKGAGVVAGMLRASIIVLIIFIGMNMIPHEYLNRLFGEESAIGRVVVKYVPAIKEKLENRNSAIHKHETEDVSSDRDQL
jgi:uncharacterized membrane protein required for colicin V production